MLLHYRKLRSILLERLIFSTKPLVGLIYKPTPWNYTREELQALPTGSFGYAIGTKLAENGYELLPSYESHDAKHLLLNYEMNAEDEGRMQFFLLGNGNWFVSVLLTVVTCIVLMPDQWGNFYRDYQRGKATHTNVSALDLENLLFYNLTHLQQELQIVWEDKESCLVG